MDDPVDPGFPVEGDRVCIVSIEATITTTTPRMTNNRLISNYSLVRLFSSTG